MKLSAFIVAAIVPIVCFSAYPQQLTQTIRGNVLDKDNQSPLIGASVTLVSSDPLIGTVTDVNGNFQLDRVPVGRVTLKINYVGYKEFVVPNLLVGSAKEPVLNITLMESVSMLDQVTVRPIETKGEVENEMALVSGHTFSVDETSRFAGSFDDPSRKATSFAGVVGDAGYLNDIVVRGNSPKGILWRLEGVPIPNPNHFAGEGTTGGPINALSSRMLNNSDFYTGAFAPEYGDATSGVFDMQLRRGNNGKREFTAGISTLGVDLTVEGPLKEKRLPSYIVTYRYSSLDLIQRAGILDIPAGVPQYQDLSFKIQIPSENHLLTLFGLGGQSALDNKNIEKNSAISQKFKGYYTLGVVGITDTWQINSDIYLKTSLAITGSGNSYHRSVPDSLGQFFDREKGNISKTSLIGMTAFNYKISAQHKIETGLIWTSLSHSMYADQWDFSQKREVNKLSDEGQTSTFQSYAAWKWRITEDLTMISGIHFLQLMLNDNRSVEPRFAMKWQSTKKSSVNIGLGVHSKLEGISTYLAKTPANGGNMTQPNRNLQFMKALHAVIGLDSRTAEQVNLKMEAYYQYLYDVPIDNSGATSYSVLNITEGFANRALSNGGVGRNYGIEVTVERFLDNGFYFIGTTSLFRSFYTPLDGKERRSAFDMLYVSNLIGGKELRIGKPEKNRALFVNARIAVFGGRPYSPINLDASIAADTGIVDEIEPFSAKRGRHFPNGLFNRNTQRS